MESDEMVDRLIEVTQTITGDLNRAESGHPVRVAVCRRSGSRIRRQVRVRLSCPASE
ncbi:MAG: hypothetical protein R2854_31290 [Caldilineaceae bacterium]